MVTLSPFYEGPIVWLHWYGIGPITCNSLPSQGVTLPLPRERLFLFRHSNDLRPVVKNTFLVASPACFVCRIVVFARVKNSIGKIRHLGLSLARYGQWIRFTALQSDVLHSLFMKFDSQQGSWIIANHSDMSFRAKLYIKHILLNKWNFGSKRPRHVAWIASQSSWFPVFGFWGATLGSPLVRKFCSSS